MLFPPTIMEIIAEKDPDFLYGRLLHLIEEQLDFTTPENCAVFYSGSCRTYAEQWARVFDKQTIEMTMGGKWLDDLDLFNWKETYPKPPLPLDKVAELWGKASEKYANLASGRVFVFVDGVDPYNDYGQLRTFFRVELPLLISKNEKVDEIHFKNNWEGATKSIFVKKTKTPNYL